MIKKPAAGLLLLSALLAFPAYGARVPPQVMAFYYGWYGNPAVSGGWHHWKDVDTEHQSIRNAANFPQFGAYDSHDPKIVERQVALARSAGITGLIASWWGRGGFEDRGMPLLLAAAQKHGLSISAYYETIRGNDTGSRVQEAIADLDYLLKQYGNDPAWLRVAGKPVLFIYGRALRQLGFDEWRGVIEQVRRDNPAGVLLVATDPDRMINGLFDGFGRYNVTGRTQHRTPPEIRAWARQTYPRLVAVAGPDRISTVTVIPGYDDSQSDRPRPRPVTERWGGDTYRVLWEEAIAAMPDWILITSWNEWHEGSEIEPAVNFGSLYLQLTAGFSRRFLGGPGSTDAPR